MSTLPKTPSLFPSPRWKTLEGGRRVAGGGPGPAVWARERLWGEGKGRERPKGSIPNLNLGKGGPQGRDSWRRRSAGGGDHGGAAVGLNGGQGEGGE